MQSAENQKSELRKRAEAKLAARGEPLPELSAYDSRELIQELRTHQIELEIQNEELRQSEQMLTEARDNFADLYDFSPVGYVTLSSKAIVLRANLTAACMLDIERSDLIGKSFSSFVEDSMAFGEYLHKCFHTSEVVTTKVDIKVRGGRFSSHLTGNAIESVEFKAKVLGLAITDLSLYMQG
ncbi:MAG TPA: PAS domain-containing protein [Mariprofundaceae bacterium]|nr:PAS domain-containing protein [Mariprofundaceae bacterium]